MKTQDEIIEQIEFLKRYSIESGTVTFNTLTLEIFHYFHAFIQNKYTPSGGEWLPLTAALLTRTFMFCYGNNQPYTPQNVIENVEDKLIIVLAAFDMFHDEINKTYNQGKGGIPPTAAVLAMSILNFDCDWFGGGEEGKEPTAVYDEFTYQKQVSVDPLYFDLLANDEDLGTVTDFELNNEDGFNYSGILMGTWGTLSLFDLMSNEVGTYHFSYRVKNTSGWSNWQTAKIYVTNVEFAGENFEVFPLPIIEEPGFNSCLVEISSHISPGGLDYTIDITQAPANGTMEDINLNGDFTYKSNENYYLNDEVKYTVTVGGETSAEYTITVTGIG